MKAQKGFGTEWTDDILDVSSYKYFSISLQHSETSFTNNRFWVKPVKLMVQTFTEWLLWLLSGKNGGSTNFVLSSQELEQEITVYEVALPLEMSSIFCYKLKLAPSFLVHHRRWSWLWPQRWSFTPFKNAFSTFWKWSRCSGVCCTTWGWSGRERVLEQFSQWGTCVVC